MLAARAEAARTTTHLGLATIRQCHLLCLERTEFGNVSGARLRWCVGARSNGRIFS